MTATDIKSETDKDPLLNKVVRNGWPVDDPTCDKDLQPHFKKKDELSAHGGCLLWDSRVIVPPKCRERIMKELHESHPGTYLTYKESSQRILVVARPGSSVGRTST